jgi:hypothetical protein
MGRQCLALPDQQSLVPSADTPASAAGQNQSCGVVQCGHLVVTQFYELQRRQFLPPAPCVIIDYYHRFEPGGDVNGLALKTAWR